MHYRLSSREKARLANLMSERRPNLFNSFFAMPRSVVSMVLQVSVPLVIFPLSTGYLYLRRNMVGGKLSATEVVLSTSLIGITLIAITISLGGYLNRRKLKSYSRGSNPTE